MKRRVNAVFIVFLVAAITVASSLRTYDEDVDEEENLDFRSPAAEALTNRLRMSFVQCIVDQCMSGETSDQSDYVTCIQEQCPVFSHRWRASSAGSATSAAAAEPRGRKKRWQYTDMLQLCIRTNCYGQRGVSYYNCVYRRCITPQQPPYLWARDWLYFTIQSSTLHLQLAVSVTPTLGCARSHLLSVPRFTSQNAVHTKPRSLNNVYSTSCESH